MRSGQSVIFMEGDVTILGSVGSGAEIVAGGSIHVYGALRGRALAGAAGNCRARIFSTASRPNSLRSTRTTKRPTRSMTAYAADPLRLGLMARRYRFQR